MKLLDLLFEKYNLRNGLGVILHKNPLSPLVAVNIWYNVGSASEVKGKTGLAHLFEHMMFQGSKNVPKEMHFRYIQEAGGSLNASTSFDRTNYFEKLPFTELELALWLESDRMGYFLDALDQVKLDNQRSVVLNERLQRYDNQPYGLAWEKLITNIYPQEHPYSWPTIGFNKDIEGYTLEDVSSFFKRYYSPSNATIVVAGNIQIESTQELLEKYFGNIPGNGIISEISYSEPLIKETKTIRFEDNVNLERIYLAWISTKSFDENDASLDVLADVLTGSKNARLTRKLVYELEIAQDVSSAQISGKYGGHFLIVATAKPGISLDIIKNSILDEISQLSENGITEQELNRSKNTIKSNFIYSLQHIDTIADLMNLYNFYLGDPNSFNYDLSRYTDLNTNELQHAANKFFKNNFVELQMVPKVDNANR